MNFYQSTLIIFTILFIVVMLFVYYLFVSKKTSIKSKYDSCPDYWTMDPATAFCNPLAMAFINYGPPKDITDITNTNILTLVSAETKGNVIEGNTQPSSTAVSCTPTKDGTINQYYITMKTSSVFRLKIKNVDCDEITLVFAIKATSNFDLMTAYNYPSGGSLTYSYYIIGTASSFAITTRNGNGSAVTYTNSSITFTSDSNYVITVYLKKSYTASEYIKFNVNETDYTTAVGKVSSTDTASVFNLNNEYIAFGNYNTGITSSTTTTYPCKLYQFVQFNRNIPFNEVGRYLCAKYITTATNIEYIDKSTGFVNFNDPKWYSDYNSSQSLECSWQQWCRENNIQWSGITNGTFC